MIRPPPEEVRALFALYNHAFFGGVLRTPVRWCRMRAYGDCLEPSGKWPYGLIRLSTLSLDDEARWDEVLLHECVHAFLDLMYPDTDEYDRGAVSYHGPVFRDECNRIGTKLGLPSVDEEHCWNWPMCVRVPHHPELAREE